MWHHYQNASEMPYSVGVFAVLSLDVTSVSCAFNWSRGRGAMQTPTARRYATQHKHGTNIDFMWCHYQIASEMPYSVDVLCVCYVITWQAYFSNRDKEETVDHILQPCLQYQQYQDRFMITCQLFSNRRQDEFIILIFHCYHGNLSTFVPNRWG